MHQRSIRQEKKLNLTNIADYGKQHIETCGLADGTVSKSRIL